jgi:hypothetical protein
MEIEAWGVSDDEFGDWTWDKLDEFFRSKLTPEELKAHDAWRAERQAGASGQA